MKVPGAPVAPIEHVRLDRVDRLDEPQRLVVVRIRQVVGQQVGPAAGDEAVHVDEPETAARLRKGEPLAHQRRGQEVGDSRRRGACAEKHDPQIAKRASRDAGGRIHSRERHRRGSLNVVVEAEHAIAIRVEERVGVRRQEVLELDQGVRVPLLHGANEFVHQGVVRRPGQALARIPDVELVIPQGRVVGADVELHRQAVPRRNAGTRRIERQLADGNAHAVRAEIAEPQDALAIGDDDHPDVLLRPVGENLRDASAIVWRDEEPFRLADDVRELAAGLADRGRVDPREHFLDVGDNRPVEQMFVPLLHRGERHVAIDVARQPPQRVHHAIDELGLGGDRMRQKTLQPQA